VSSPTSLKPLKRTFDASIVTATPESPLASIAHSPASATQIKFNDLLIVIDSR
jgi:hypothetical protein